MRGWQAAFSVFVVVFFSPYASICIPTVPGILGFFIKSLHAFIYPIYIYIYISIIMDFKLLRTKDLH